MIALRNANNLLLKKLDEGNKQQMFVPVHAMRSHSKELVVPEAQAEALDEGHQRRRVHCGQATHCHAAGGTEVSIIVEVLCSMSS